MKYFSFKTIEVNIIPWRLTLNSGTPCPVYICIYPLYRRKDIKDRAFELISYLRQLWGRITLSCPTYSETYGGPKILTMSYKLHRHHYAPYTFICRYKLLLIYIYTTRNSYKKGEKEMINK